MLSSRCSGRRSEEHLARSQHSSLSLAAAAAHYVLSMAVALPLLSRRHVANTLEGRVDLALVEQMARLRFGRTGNSSQIEDYRSSNERI